MLIAPPPWTLTGNGIVLIAHFPEAFAQAQGFLAPYQQRTYRGWIGTVMLVDYATSPVGPYQELLFIPGLFRFGDTTSFSISKIYVSTTDSVWNGRRNWGIPKELADFSFVSNPDDSRTISVRSANQPLLTLRAMPWGPRFPITTKLLPGFRIMQERPATDESTPEPASGLLLTRPSATGLARLTRLSELRVNPVLFPDLTLAKPLVALSVETVSMTFPHPQWHSC